MLRRRGRPDAAAVLVGLLAAQRLLELRHARGNERRARTRGAVEHGAGHYPLIVALHAAWLLATAVEGRGHRARPVWLGVLAGCQALRWWCILTLGPQWTTRVLVDPTATPVRTGPYRWLRHPNYLAVAGEIVALPLAFDAVRTAAVSSAANAALLRHRIRVEDAARAGLSPSTTP